MAIQIDTDFLALDFKEREVAVPVDALDRSKGCVNVTVREIPYAVKRSLELRSNAAYARLPKAQEILNDMTLESFDAKQVDKVGETLGAFRDTQLELVKWGVCGHRAEDFLVRGEPFPFESVPLLFAGVSYQVASAKMLQLYVSASGRNNPLLHTTLLANIANAVRAFQDGTVIEPEEVWTAYEKPTA
jgi:hypothetical protein